MKPSSHNRSQLVTKNKNKQKKQTKKTKNKNKNINKLVKSVDYSLEVLSCLDQKNKIIKISII
jgi:hypothetical protein